MYNLLIGGAAGQGIDTTAAILEKLLKRSGYAVFTMRDFMSRVRGGHNFTQIRFGDQPLYAHSDELDGIIALNDETAALHAGRLKDGGFILCDTAIQTDDPRTLRIDMNAIAKAAGNARASGSVAVGAVLGLFGVGLDAMEDVLPAFVKEQYLQSNFQALRQGYDAVQPRFQAQRGDFADTLMMTGSRAMALGAVAAGLKFYSAYPMSPSTTLMEVLAATSEKTGVVVEQAEDEIAAINMAIGASFAGARAMTGTSGGGFSLMVEALGLSGMAEIPLVVVDVQRPGPVTGLPTRTEQSDLKFVISASQGEFPRMVIAVRNHTDAFYQTARAFHLAEKYQIPVILLSDQYLGDASATVPAYDLEAIHMAQPATAHEGEGEYLRYRLTDSGVSPRLIPGKTEHLVTADSDEHDERGHITESAEVRVAMMDKRIRKLEGLRAELQEPDFLGDEACHTLLLGWGSLWGPIKEAVELMGPGYGALVFGDIDPLPTARLLEKAAAVRRIVNVEQNATGQLAGLIREHTGIACHGSVIKYDGRQMTAAFIADAVRKGEGQ